MKTKFKAIGLIASLSLVSSYTNGATLEFNSDSENVIAGCAKTVSIVLDTEGQTTSAMDLRVSIDSSQAEFNDFNGDGGIFRAYTSPRISKSDKKETMYVLATTSSRFGINTKGNVGKLTFTPKAGVKSVDLTIEMLSGTDTTDSNVAVVSGTKAIDVLSSVKNAKYTVTEGKCEQPDLIALTPETTKTLALEENEMYVSQNAREENMDAVGARLRIYFKYWGSILALGAIGAGYYIWKKRQTK